MSIQSAVSCSVPRSVICSPSHMMNAVPVVSVTMVITRNPQPGSKTTLAPPGVSLHFSRMVAHGPNQQVMVGNLAGVLLTSADGISTSAALDATDKNIMLDSETKLTLFVGVKN